MTKNNKFRPAVAKRQIAQFAKNKTTVKIGLLVKCWFLLLVKQTKNIPICDWHILFGDTGQMTSLWSKWHYWSKWHQFAQNDTTLVKMTLLWSKWHHFCQNGITLAKITSFWSGDLTFWHESLILFAINAFILWSVRKYEKMFLGDGSLYTHHFLLWNTAGDWVNAERSAHAQKCWEVLLAPDLAPCPTKEHYVTLQYMYITDSLWFSWLHFWG